MTTSAQLPTLPGHVEGIVERTPFGWAVQCRECGRMGRGRTMLMAMIGDAIRFHAWPDGSNPRLCRECRQSRACDCVSCGDERRGTGR